MQYYKPEDYTIDETFIVVCFRYSEHAFKILNGRNGREKVGRNGREKVGRNTALPVTKKRIIELISTNNQITAKALSETIGLTQKAIEKNIKQLKDSGFLERKNGDRGGYWKILK